MSDTIEKKDEEVEFDADIFESMVNGSFEEPAEAEEVEEDDSVEDEDDAEEEQEEEQDALDEDDEDEDNEDTDQDSDEDADEELDEDSDGDLDEDSEEETEDEEENTPVDDDSSDDEDGDAEGEDEDSDDEEELDADEDADEESEEDTETTDQSDGDGEDTDEIDYKAFYDSVVNTDFVVNGKKTRGFSDPKKIIQSMQMAGGFSEKMAGFKQYRPFMAPLKERGMLEDQAKFDLAMNLLDGDKEAIKQHLHTLKIDPMELDMDVIKYEGKSNIASAESLIIEDVMERAKGAGIEDRVREVLGKEWDTASFNEFVGNETVRNDLLSHMESGAYDKVQDKMTEMSRLDFNGSYGNMNTINKYRAAVKELHNETPKVAPVAKVEKPATVVKKAAPKASVKTEKAKIAKSRKEEEYKVKAAKQEAKIANQRKRASSMSKKKAKAPAKAKFDPLELAGDEFDKHMEFLISGGRQ